MVALSLLGTSCSDSGSSQGESGDGRVAGGDDTELGVEVVSTRSDMVTGGDALLQVDAEPVESVTVDGEDAEVDFRASEGTSLGLLEGLPEGPSTVAVTADGKTAELEVVNHPENGPVFSGERLPMVVCTTQRYGLAEAEPPECQAEPVVRLGYIDDEGTVQFLDGATVEEGSIPADAATVEIDGVEQPAVLRVESRVIDRGVATIVTLADASEPGADLVGSWSSGHWNGRLVYRFGGGCGTTYSQGFNFFDAPSVELLADGYAFATNTLNTFQVQCQDIVSAEAAMMTKEYFAENYGLPEVTIGEGGSGGAIQQFLIAQNYPGILDAIAPTSPFPDAMSIAPGVLDCALLGSTTAPTPARRSVRSSARRSTVTCRGSPA
ncbi:MAG: DUF6351 family protein [Microthrixaceae bacterium]|nr:DUF6351 family protein [Microthrixaceae bacterium]